jgi:serine/threonine protein kinase
VSQAEKVPALMLEFVRGTSLHALPLEDRISNDAFEAIQKGHHLQDYKKVPNAALQEALERTYASITDAGVLHGDPKPDNFIKCEDGAVIAVDFEFACPLPDGENHEKELRTILYGFDREASDAARLHRQEAARSSKGIAWGGRMGHYM